MKPYPLLLLLAAAAPAQQPAPLPTIIQKGAAKQLMVDGKPFLMLSGELHNSSASSVAYMAPIWPRLQALHLNTVVGTVSWELMEPTEGHFDFTLVDAQIAAARQHSMHLVLIWFASWKNTSSEYPPLWVKEDKLRFTWAKQLQGPTPEHPKRGLYALSPFSKNAQDADAKAFRALMRHLRETDPQHTVVMMQLENEVGILTEGRDHSTLADAAWSAPVPPELMQYLSAHKAQLLPETLAVWTRNGFRTSGTWAEVFGNDLFGEEIFSAWYFGRYIDSVAAAGKQELALPMYVNAWQMPSDTAPPGSYPSGGPVSRMLDIWKAAAPNISLLAPDVYGQFEEVCASYNRQGNPLFFPESRDNPGNYLWAIGRYNALGVSPFGVDDLREDDPLGELYGQLSGALSVILQAQQTNSIAAFPPRNSGDATASLGGFDIRVKYTATKVSNIVAPATNGAAPTVAPDVIATRQALAAGQTGYGMVIAAGPNEFYVMGRGMALTFNRPATESNDWVIAEMDEGSFLDGKWIAGRRLNGDEGPSLRHFALPSDHFVIRHIRLYHHPGPGSVG
jgi:hypothetical protein